MTGVQNAIAHGGGGGGSYDLDKQGSSVDRAAEKKAAEKKQDQDTWDSFMNDINAQKKDSATEKTTGDSHDNADTSAR
jgi:hypothetical protein